MAEFKEVMKEANRMCNSQDSCKSCDFRLDERLCKMTGEFDDDDLLETFEKTVLSWASEHPAKRYPTWREWGNSISMCSSPHVLLPCHFIDCHREDGRCPSPCPYLDNEIPEEFAVKANIRPIEKKVEEKKAGGFTFD